MVMHYINTNAQPNGDHEVHTETCRFLPNHENIRPLGNFPHCIAAMEIAKIHERQVNGCSHCCEPCHKR